MNREDKLLTRLEKEPAYITAAEARVLLTIIRGLKKELIELRAIVARKDKS
jgi:hypothetical protein